MAGASWKLGAAFFLLLGLVGLAHLPLFSPFLRWASGPSCPLGMDKQLSLEERDTAFEASIQKLRGSEKARSRPAFGFLLDQSHRSELLAWAAKSGVSCEEKGLLVECGRVPEGALPVPFSLDSLSFQVDGRDLLVAITARCNDFSAEEALRKVEEMSGRMVEEVGPFTTQQGEPSSEWLLKGALNQRRVEFRFSDYRTEISATNLGNQRISFRWMLQSLVGRI